MERFSTKRHNSHLLTSAIVSALLLTVLAVVNYGVHRDVSASEYEAMEGAN